MCAPRITSARECRKKTIKLFCGIIIIIIVIVIVVIIIIIALDPY